MSENQIPVQMRKDHQMKKSKRGQRNRASEVKGKQIFLEHINLSFKERD